jgi:hypothetical protein
MFLSREEDLNPSHMLLPWHDKMDKFFLSMMIVVLDVEHVLPYVL